MNATRTLRTLLTLLLPLTVSAGELDGKRLICNLQESWGGYESVNPEIRGFHFDDGEVSGEELVVNGSDLNWQPLKPAYSQIPGTLSYIDNPTEVRWWTREYSLNRQTLMLSWEISKWDKTYQGEFLCEVFDTPESYSETFSRYRHEELKKLKKIMKDNKI